MLVITTQKSTRLLQNYVCYLIVLLLFLVLLVQSAIEKTQFKVNFEKYTTIQDANNKKYETIKEQSYKLISETNTRTPHEHKDTLRDYTSTVVWPSVRKRYKPKLRKASSNLSRILILLATLSYASSHKSLQNSAQQQSTLHTTVANIAAPSSTTSESLESELVTTGPPTELFTISRTLKTVENTPEDLISLSTTVPFSATTGRLESSSVTTNAVEDAESLLNVYEQSQSSSTTEHASTNFDADSRPDLPTTRQNIRSRNFWPAKASPITEIAIRITSTYTATDTSTSLGRVLDPERASSATKSHDTSTKSFTTELATPSTRMTYTSTTPDPLTSQGTIIDPASAFPVTKDHDTPTAFSTTEGTASSTRMMYTSTTPDSSISSGRVLDSESAFQATKGYSTSTAFFTTEGITPSTRMTYTPTTPNPSTSQGIVLDQKSTSSATKRYATSTAFSTTKQTVPSTSMTYTPTALDASTSQGTIIDPASAFPVTKDHDTSTAFSTTKGTASSTRMMYTSTTPDSSISSGRVLDSESASQATKGYGTSTAFFTTEGIAPSTGMTYTPTTPNPSTSQGIVLDQKSTSSATKRYATSTAFSTTEQTVPSTSMTYTPTALDASTSQGTIIDPASAFPVTKDHDTPTAFSTTKGTASSTRMMYTSTTPDSSISSGRVLDSESASQATKGYGTSTAFFTTEGIEPSTRMTYTPTTPNPSTSQGIVLDQKSTSSATKGYDTSTAFFTTEQTVPSTSMTYTSTALDASTSQGTIIDPASAFPVTKDHDTLTAFPTTEGTASSTRMTYTSTAPDPSTFSGIVLDPESTSQATKNHDTSTAFSTTEGTAPSTRMMYTSTTPDPSISSGRVLDSESASPGTEGYNTSTAFSTTERFRMTYTSTNLDPSTSQETVLKPESASSVTKGSDTTTELSKTKRTGLNSHMMYTSSAPDSLTLSETVLGPTTVSPANEEHSSTTEFPKNPEISSEEPTIKQIELNETKCPDNMTYYGHFLGLPFCYVLTESQSYPPLCPYENNVDFDAIKEIYRLFRHIRVWVSARRETKSSLGEFVYTDKSSRYLSPISAYEDPGEFILNKTCMVQKYKRLIPVSCSEQYPALCVYTYYKKTIEKFCSKRSQLKCISKDFNLTNKCFCQTKIELMNISRSVFCEKLAEPDRFQNHLLLTQLSNKAPCWFGAEKTEEGDFVWSNSRTRVDYSYWKENVDASNKFGAMDYLTPKGWILEKDGSLKCAICEIDVPYREVKLELRYSSRNASIRVRIQNIFDIHNHFYNDYFFACFSDYNLNGFKFKVVARISDFRITTDNYTVKIPVRNHYPAYYWCETFQRPHFKHIVSNKILVYDDRGIHKHEYALITETTVPKHKDPLLLNVHLTLANTLVEQLNVTEYINVIRPVEIVKFKPEVSLIEILFHISTMESGKSSLDEFHELESLLNSAGKYERLIKFGRSDVCLKDVTNVNNVSLTWPETSIGSTTIPKELCLQDTSLPVTRKCHGDFLFGGFWGDVQGNCSLDITYSNRTLSLYDLLNSDSNSSTLTESLCNITNDQKDVLVVDVHLMVEILEKSSTNENGSLQDIVDIYSNMMKFDKDVLNQSQSLLNSTDKALDVLDSIVSQIDLKDENCSEVESEKLIVQASSLTRTNITGIALINNATTPLYNGVSIDELMQNDVTLAMHLDAEILEKIQKCALDEEAKLVLILFWSDVLFNEVSQERSGERHQAILSVLIVNFDCDFDIPIHVIYKHGPYKTSNNSCAHWKYGLDGTHTNLQGAWEVDSLSEEARNFSEYSVCGYNHTTHFALLMLNEKMQDYINPETRLALNIITAIGCGLSLLGILGIFVTALAFRSWRHHSSNIINLNFSISIAAQMVFLFVADSAKKSTIWCYVSGASLHYTVLSEFAWMLIIGVFQYKKFVLVFEVPIRYMILKCLIVGWGVPLIPVLIVLALCSESYQENSTGLCYPKYSCFYLGVALPVGAIVVINLFIFITILRNVCNRKIKSYGHKQNRVKLQVLLAVLLFFLLGMSWIFGLAVAFFKSSIWSYLFCLTATLQGFVMFIFFVVMNEKSRLLWSRVQSFNLVGLKNGVIWYKIFITKK